ncbi:MAG: hypothetical protein MI867_27190 [Pseudomonadales bacterium]|nr:hypothetical protein [Pseudomonadales bacterium]
MEIAPQGLGVALVSAKGKGVPTVNVCEFKPCAPGGWGEALKEFCKAQSLKNVKTYVAFHPEFYDLMLIDAPEVPDEELRDAVKWRVKDFASGDIEDYVVDAFRLPEDAYRGRMNMIYAAYMKKEAVIPIVELCEELELDLVEIGVSELARARIAAGREELTDLGVAFLHMEEKKGQIDLIENGCLYLTRGIDTGYGMLNQGESEGELSLDNSSQFDSLALDIQRSLDYYESQLGKSGISKLWIVTAEPLSKEACESLSEKLPVQVEAFDICVHFNCEQGCSGFMDSCSVAVGATLGGDDVAA